ncbi:hypothetical protein [Bacillus phage Anath]|uniref:Uncharacterized protein n=1 Tax=Bacillus phage Anath TaxID=2108114 RepID=A0A2P1JUI8_9CAUD|nr:hypothetical protein [Bacillus phage Anath]
MDNEQGLFYISEFSEVTNFEEKQLDELGVVKEAELFSTGTHRGTDYTVEDLNTLASNFSVDERVPIQLDHSESVRDTVGFLEEAKVVGDKLMGKVRIIDEFTQERIDKKLMGKVSISFYIQYNEEEDRISPHKLREVSLVAFPQVKSAQLFCENGYVSYNTKEKEAKPMAKENTQFQLTPEQLAQFEEVGNLIEKYNELQAQVATLNAEKVNFKAQTIASQVEKFQEDNKIVPAQADALTALLTSLSEEQVGLFNAFMNDTQSIDLGERGEIETPDNADKRTQEQKDFDAFYEQHEAKYGASL